MALIPGRSNLEPVVLFNECTGIRVTRRGRACETCIPRKWKPSTTGSRQIIGQRGAYRRSYIIYPNGKERDGLEVQMPFIEYLVQRGDDEIQMTPLFKRQLDSFHGLAFATTRGTLKIREVSHDVIWNPVPLTFRVETRGSKGLQVSCRGCQMVPIDFKAEEMPRMADIHFLFPSVVFSLGLWQLR